MVRVVECVYFTGKIHFGISCASVFAKVSYKIFDGYVIPRL